MNIPKDWIDRDTQRAVLVDVRCVACYIPEDLGKLAIHQQEKENISGHGRTCGWSLQVTG